MANTSTVTVFMLFTFLLVKFTTTCSKQSSSLRSKFIVS